MQKKCDLTFKITKVKNTIVHTKLTRIEVSQLRSWAERINMTFPVFQLSSLGITEVLFQVLIGSLRHLDRGKEQRLQLSSLVVQIATSASV